MRWGEPSTFSIEYLPHEDSRWSKYLSGGYVYVSVAGQRREVGTNDVITCIWNPFEAIRTDPRLIESADLFSLTGTQLLKRAYRGVYAWPRAWWAGASERGLAECDLYKQHVLYIGGAARSWFLVAVSHGNRTRVAMADQRNNASRRHRPINGLREIIRPGFEVVLPTADFLAVARAFVEFGEIHPWWEGLAPIRSVDTDAATQIQG